MSGYIRRLEVELARMDPRSLEEGVDGDIVDDAQTPGAGTSGVGQD